MHTATHLSNEADEKFSPLPGANLSCRSRGQKTHALFRGELAPIVAVQTSWAPVAHGVQRWNSRCCGTAALRGSLAAAELTWS
eukprot:COSAG02_NODE_113_length_35905_cov_25.229012_11_plen_83_part_00